MRGRSEPGLSLHTQETEDRQEPEGKGLDEEQIGWDTVTGRQRGRSPEEPFLLLVAGAAAPQIGPVPLGRWEAGWRDFQPHPVAGLTWPWLSRVCWGTRH